MLIDEISLVAEVFFTKLDQVLRIRKNRRHAVFGGIKVVCIGDFGQLAPVGDVHSHAGDALNKAQVKAGYAFESPAWEQGNFVKYQLRHIWRWVSMHGRACSCISL